MAQSLGKILVLDGDSHIRELLRCNLRAEGYEVDSYPDVALARSLDLSETRVVILDAFGQPDGQDVLRALTTSHSTAHIGVIVCSSGESAGEAIMALDGGADDYIAKPFAARDDSQGARSDAPPPSDGRRQHRLHRIVRPLVHKLHHTHGHARRQAVEPYPTEYSILAMLMKNRDRHLTRIEIYREVWNSPEAGNNERVVDTNISRLRRKLGDLGPALQNHTGSGYILVEP